MFPRTALFTLLLSTTLLPTALAANDWSVPCFNGQCSYEAAGDGTTRTSGTISLSAQSKWAVSDISQASGWVIMNCDANSTQPQSIRLYCQSGDMSSNGCGHLFEQGSENTIVRLPEDCANAPFARVAKTWVHADQTLPESLKRNLRRDNTTASGPQVQGMNFDFNFAAVPPSNGNVSLQVSGSNIPGVGNQTTTPPASRRSYSTRRRHNLAGRHVPRLQKRNFIGDFIDGIEKLTTFDETFNKQLPPVDVNKNFPLFHQSISCPQAGKIPAFTGSVDFDADANLHAVVSYGYVVTGTVVPPHVDDLAIYVAMQSSIGATFNVKASATGTLDSGSIPLFNVGLPGLSFPGIIDIGPSFSINGQVIGKLAVDADVKVGASWNLPKVQLVFPPSKGASSGDAVPTNSPLSLSASPSVQAAGSVEAHLIPRIDVGLKLLGDTADATIFMNVDVSGKLDMQVQAKASATSNGTDVTSTLAQASGCVDLTGDISINAGAEGKLLNFFDESTSVKIFDKQVDLFKKCFDTASKRGAPTLPPAALLKRGDLTCPSAGTVTALKPILSETVTPPSS